MEIDQTAAAEVVTVEVSGAVGVVRLRVPALSRLAKEQLLAGLRAAAEARVGRFGARAHHPADGRQVILDRTFGNYSREVA